MGTITVLPLDGSPARVHTLKAGPGSPMTKALSFEPSGRRLAASFRDDSVPGSSIRILDLETGTERDLRADADRGDCKVAPGTQGENPFWLPDGRLLSNGPAGLRLWDLEKGTSRQVRACHDAGELGELTRYGATPDSRIVVGLQSHDSRSGRLSEFWAFDLTTGAERNVTSHGSRVKTFALDPTGSTLVTGDADGLVRVGPLSGEGAPHLLYGHSRMVTSVAVSPDGQWIASGSDDGTIRLWPMPVGPPLQTLPYEELLTKLRSLTNLRVVTDAASATGYKLEAGPFPGWANVPVW